MLQKKRIQFAQLIFIMILVYSACCLPFSLKNALSLWFPNSDENILNGPEMLTLLYFLCVSQFSLNFVIYTIIPNPMREAHKKMWIKLWTYVTYVTLATNFHTGLFVKVLQLTQASRSQNLLVSQI